MRVGVAARTSIGLLTVALCTAAELRKDIEFARPAGESLTLDASIADGPGPHPAVIVVHGGGFIAGDKQTFVTPLFEPLTRGGFVWFTINYRLAPRHKFPAAVEDVQQAIRWVRQHAHEFKADPDRLALVGESAGGHLVAHAGVQNDPPVSAVVSFYGVHDFISVAIQRGRVTDTSQAFLGIDAINSDTAPVAQRASPFYLVKRGLPPFLLIHGTEDRQVPYEQSVQMCEKLKLAGVPCELYTVRGGPHGVGAWEKHPDLQNYKVHMVEWLKRVLTR